MRALVRALVLALIGLTLMPAPSAGATTRASVDHGDIRMHGPELSASAFFTVADGQEPTSVTFNLESDPDVRSGWLRARVGGSTLGTWDLSAVHQQAVSVALPQQLKRPVEIAFDGRADRGDDRCSTAGPSVLVSSLALQLDGQVKAPVDVSGFMRGNVDQVTIIKVGDGPGLDAAVLAASGVLGRAFGSATLSIEERKSLGDLPVADRVVIVRAAPKAKVTLISTPTQHLVMEGEGQALVQTIESLGFPSSVAATSSDLGESRSQAAIGATEMALGELSPGSWRISNSGNATRSTAAPQSLFGSPVRELRLHLVGTHTAVHEGQEVTADVLWNGELARSVRLDSNDAFEADVVIDETKLERDNTLTIAVSTGVSGGCRGLGGVTLSIDPKASRIQAQTGQGLKAGFGRFPQVLGKELPVSLGEGPGDLRRAGVLVAALQRASSSYLPVRLVDLRTPAKAFVVVGASAEQAQALGAPLSPMPFRQIDAGATRFTYEVNQPFGMIEAFSKDSRDILLLTSFEQDRWADELVAQLNGKGHFNQLAGSIQIMTSNGQVEVPLTQISPQPRLMEDGPWKFLGLPAIFWAVVGTAAVVLAGKDVRRFIWRVLARRRLRRQP